MTTCDSTILALLIASFTFQVSCYIKYKDDKYERRVSPPGSPWPLPQQWLTTDQTIVLDAETFSISLAQSYETCDIVEEAIKRAKKNLFFDPRARSSTSEELVMNELKINIENVTCGYPRYGDNENYTLEITADETYATLTGDTVWSVVRGLETFTQLVWQDENRHYRMNKTTIEDWPQYKYRGLLVDTARHFLPMKILLDNLDAMAYNKLNVFHWHIVDDESFPMESKRFPNLTRLGAYTQDHVYSQEDIRQLVEAARLRGIRVIPEVDSPGHTRGLARAFPELIASCDEGTPFTERHSKRTMSQMLDPTNEKVYQVMHELFCEVRQLFPDEYIHLGMDELDRECCKCKFNDSSEMVAIKEMERYYMNRTLENVRALGYKYMTWQDHVDTGAVVAEDAVVQVWKDTELVNTFRRWQTYVIPIVKRKYQVVLSSCWYLNNIKYGPDWQRFYKCDPRQIDASSEEKELVIGGEACMWGDYVDATNILPRLWPRASAVAERLWSNPSATQSTDDAEHRLDEHRCRMLRRGIPAQPISSGHCGEYDLHLFSSEAKAINPSSFYPSHPSSSSPVPSSSSPVPSSSSPFPSSSPPPLSSSASFFAPSSFFIFLFAPLLTLPTVYAT